MKRRDFLIGGASLASFSLPRRSAARPIRETAAGKPVDVRINTAYAAVAIPPDFMGLGYEISSVAVPRLLSAENHRYVQLVKTLSRSGVIRVGGNTSDFASFQRNGRAVSTPEGTIVNEAALKDLASFLKATGWRLIWGLNLGKGSEAEAVEEALAVAAVTGDSLLALEIGNEPDVFGRGTKHRPREYSYDDYLQEYRRYKQAIRAKLPGVAFAGPDAASAVDWVVRFAQDEGVDLKLLTHHYYRECAHPTTNLDELLNPDPKLAPELAKFAAAATASHVPFRICETNSFCGGGKDGVSNTFGAALWSLDFLFKLVFTGAAGVNMETGVNQLGFVSYYSPIGDDERGDYSAQPEYYGMLAFAQASRGNPLRTVCAVRSLNLSAYAMRTEPDKIALTVINKDRTSDADVQIAVDGHVPSHASVMRLTAPSLVRAISVLI